MIDLLAPRVVGLRNTVVRGERRMLFVLLAVVGLAFWAGMFGSVYWLVGKFWIVEGFGPFLARKLLEMMLASLFVMLCFSNVVTALSTYYLSEDLELVLSLPVSRPRFHYARLLDTMAQSSWMMGLFGLPVFLAYGLRIGAGPGFYVALLLAIPALLLIAADFGAVLATVLVNVFPARRTRELMVLLGILGIAGLFILLRTLRPERLVSAQEFDTLAGYLAQLQLPQPRMFPPTWASSVLTSTLLYQPFPWLDAGLLLTGALAASAIARWTTAWGFDGGWARAQEARAARFYRSESFDRLARLLPASWRPMAAKEMRVFARDPSQWSQVFLLIGVCGIYLVSVQTLPMDTFQGKILAAIKQTIALLNLGMGGFVMAAIAARFQFTAVSREGRAWWLVRGAPVDPAAVLRAKAALGIVPMLVVGLVVVVGSGVLLDAPAPLLLVEGVTTLFLAYGISGIAVSMGALFPDFRADTAARAASGPAAVFFMVVALVLVFSVLALEAVAVMLYVARAGTYGWAAGVPLFLAAAICVAAGTWPVRRSAEVLWARGL
ncbi:MAG: putative ABC transporter permease subunit [Myxococcota bacterium]